MGVTITKKSNLPFGYLTKTISELRKSEVLVGIPAATTPRKGQPINNASLLMLQENGSPLKNIPPRPVLRPSIEANKGIIAPHLAAAAQEILNPVGDPLKVERELQLAGTIAANGAKRWMSKEHLVPNAPSTIRRKGSDTPLVDESALRRSITSLVRTKE